MASQTQPFDHSHSNFFVEAKCIVTAYYSHFLAFAFLFFFPVWFSLISLPSFIQTVILSNAFLNSHIIIVLAFVYALLVFSLSVAGIATITYSTHQSFDHQPLSFFTTIKSLSRSFFPLAPTVLTLLACLILICIVPLVSAALLLYAIKSFGFEINYSSYYFFLVCVLASIIVGLFLVFCQVYCIVAGVFSVVESKWGFEPIRQSHYLIKEMRTDSLLLLFEHGIVNWVVVLGFSYPIFVFPQNGWTYFDIIQISLTSLFEACLILQFVAASTVLYLYSKESRVQSADEISDEYTRLVMDDNNLSHETRVENGSGWTGLIRICCMLVIIILVLHMFWYYHR